jgi:hypothetical protein
LKCLAEADGAEGGGAVVIIGVAVASASVDMIPGGWRNEPCSRGATSGGPSLGWRL